MIPKDEGTVDKKQLKPASMSKRVSWAPMCTWRPQNWFKPLQDSL